MSGVTKHPSITVTSNTSLGKVADFLANNAGDGLKLYGKLNKDGDTVLYLKSGSNLLDRLRPSGGFTSAFTSRATEKKELARSEIESLVRNSRAGLNATQQEGMDELMKAIASPKGGSVFQNRDSNFLADATSRLFALRDSLITIPEQKFSPPATAAMNDVGSVLPHSELRWAHSQFNDSGLLANNILANYGEAAPAERGAFLLALADGDKYKADLTQQLYGGDDHPLMSESKARLLASEVFDTLSANLPVTQFTGDTVSTPNPKGKSFDARPVVMKQADPANPNPDGTPSVRTQTFKPDLVLASGSFGTAVRYTDVDDPTKQIVMKFSKVDPDAQDAKAELRKAQLESANELKAHAGISQHASDHVIGFRGGVKTPDNLFAIAMDYAPNGTVKEAIGKLKDAVANNIITQNEADVLSMTLIKDMAQGLSHMHDVVGVTHFDFKSLNCLIGEDGKARIMDFGTTLATADSTAAGGAKVDNPAWKAPEIIYGESVALKKETKGRDAEAKGALQGFIRNFGLKGQAAAQLEASVMAKVGSSAFSGDQLKGANKYAADSKADVWSLGVTAYELLSGGDPFTQFGFAYLISNSLQNFAGTDRDAVGAGVDAEGDSMNRLFGEERILNTTGSTAKDAFLNRILVGNPGNRPSAADVTADEAFDPATGIGSDEAHQLIALLTAPPPVAEGEGMAELEAQAQRGDALTQARDAFRARLNG